MRRLPGTSLRRGFGWQAAVILAALALTGCSSAPYTPYTVEISDRAQFNADLKTCQDYAAAYKQSLDAKSLAVSALNGGVSGAGLVPISPLIPAATAAQSAGNTLLDQLNVMRGNDAKIVRNCLHDKGQKSGAYLVIDPNSQ